MEYFDAFGAGWVVSLLSLTELLQHSYGPVSGALIGTFFALMEAAHLRSNQKSMFKAEITLSTIALLLMGVVIGGQTLAGVRVAAMLGTIATLLLSISTGFLVVRLALELRDQDFVWGNRQLWFLYAVWIFAVTQLPMAAGYASGRLAADARHSPLPVVSLGTEEWRLLLPRIDYLVVARLTVGEKPIVKVIPADKADAIRERK